MPWKNYKTGYSKSCGKCSFVNLKDLLDIKYGLLQIAPSNNLTKLYSKNKKILFLCDCGQSKLIVLKSVLNGLTKSCGCLLKNKSLKFTNYALEYKGPPKALSKNSPLNIKKDEKWWTDQSFGRLKVCPGQGSFGKSSDIKLKCFCSCGNYHKIRASHLTSYKTKSCGKCSIRAHEWWDRTKLSKYPSDLDQFKSILKGSYLEPLEFSKKHPKIRCLLCDNTFKPNFYDIFLKQIKSCGCLNNHISSPNYEIQKFLQSLNLTCHLEQPIGNYKVDLYLPTLNLAIDYHGLYYHSEMHNAFEKDYKKYKFITRKTRYLIIYGDEWRFKRSIVQNMLKEICQKSKSISIRPKVCQIKRISFTEASTFYKKYHYIGPKSAKIHLGVFFKEKLIAAMSISTPTRKSNYDYEIVRMARNPEYRIHGLWSYLLRKVKNYNIEGNLVTFSENRLSDGNVYQKMGFTLDGEVKPNYYYTDHHRRWHKSAFRKKGEEKKSHMTEEELRKNQNLWKIWDYGKKRWVKNV